jgi:hypothetical protein
VTVLNRSRSTKIDFVFTYLALSTVKPAHCCPK